MARSIHTTQKDLKGLSKKELDSQMDDPDSDLAKLAKKSGLKKKVKTKRNQQRG